MGLGGYLKERLDTTLLKKKAIMETLMHWTQMTSLFNVQLEIKRDWEVSMEPNSKRHVICCPRNFGELHIYQVAVWKIRGGSEKEQKRPSFVQNPKAVENQNTEKLRSSDLELRKARLLGCCSTGDQSGVSGKEKHIISLREEFPCHLFSFRWTSLLEGWSLDQVSDRPSRTNSYDRTQWCVMSFQYK